MELDEAEALRAYARMMNTLSVDHLEPLLADDFVYESQAVFQAIDSKDAFLGYMRPKLQTIRGSGAIVYAEMGEVTAYGKHQPCVVLAQGEKENLVALVIAKIGQGKLKRLDLCLIPEPRSARRTREYPT